MVPPSLISALVKVMLCAFAAPAPNRPSAKRRNPDRPVLSWQFLPAMSRDLPVFFPPIPAIAIFGMARKLRTRYAKGNKSSHAFPGGHHERSDPHPAGGRRTRRQRRGVPEPARVRAQGARQPQPECLGLHRRRRRDRDHHAPQPHGARRDRVPAARAAQCRQGRRLGRGVRPQIAPAGGARAGRRARDVRSRRRRQRRARRRQRSAPPIC